MKKEKQENIYMLLLEAKGIDNQNAVCIEELAELIKELTKALRGKGNSMKIIEEMADVEVCVDQLKLNYDRNNGEGVKFFKDFKLNRLEMFYLKREQYK